MRSQRNYGQSAASRRVPLTGTDPSRRAARRTPRPVRAAAVPACASAAARTAGASQRKNGLTADFQRHAARAGVGASAARRPRDPVAILERGRDWRAPRSGRSADWPPCTRGRNTCGVSGGSARSRFKEAFICTGVPSNIRPQPALNSVSPQNSAPCPQNAMWLKVCPGTCKISKPSPKSGNSQRSPSRTVRVGYGIRASSGPDDRHRPQRRAARRRRRYDRDDGE